MRAALIVLGLVVAVVLAAVPFMPRVIYPIFVMEVMCYALFACAFNILLGFAGILSFGHAAFFATAAYTSGYVLKFLGWSTELGLLAGVATSAALGAVFGILAVRRSGIYLAMITLALAQLVYFAFRRMPFTGAENGLRQIPRSALLGLFEVSDDTAMYYLVAALTALGLFVVYRTLHSPFGHALAAVREHEERAVSLGFDVTRIKVVAFTVSAGLSGLAGSMKALVFGIASLGDAHWSASGDVVLMALLGGSGTVFGPALGAILVNVMAFYLDTFGAWVTVITGAVFVANILAFKKGILGTAQDAFAHYATTIRGTAHATRQPK